MVGALQPERLIEPNLSASNNRPSAPCVKRKMGSFEGRVAQANPAKCALMADSKCRNAAKVETTGYGPASHRAADSQPRGRWGSGAACRAPRTFALTAQFRRWLARRPLLLNIRYKRAHVKPEYGLPLFPDIDCQTGWHAGPGLPANSYCYLPIQLRTAGHGLPHTAPTPRGWRCQVFRRCEINIS